MSDNVSEEAISLWNAAVDNGDDGHQFRQSCYLCDTTPNTWITRGNCAVLAQCVLELLSGHYFEVFEVIFVGESVLYVVWD